MVAAQSILICFHDFSRGGTERIAIRLARHWVDAGRQVTILAGTGEGRARDDVDPRIGVVTLDPPIPRSPLSRLRLGRAMAELVPGLAPDVIFLPGNFHLWLAPPLSRVKGDGAVVAKISNPTVPRGTLAWLLGAIVRRYRGAVDGVATMNSGLERDLKALLPGINARTLFDPVYLDPHPTAPDAAPPDVAGGPRPLNILWAGRLERQKDVALALRVIAALDRRRVASGGARLTVLGEGSGQAALTRAIQRAGLGRIVTAPGHVTAIDPWLARADALLVTSHFEGGPAVAVEALAHGVPVVSTDCSHFLRDIMVRPEAGRIVASRDAEVLAQALAEVCATGRPDPKILQALIAHLDQEACAQAYLDWFDQVVAARRAAQPSDPRPPRAAAHFTATRSPPIWGG